ncbi:hypothetical protein SBA3_510011 [Candidatus Sulfopaludibacter sp. SbA3]|nr:hypothetical protein SBA3_510011 [Candidatus Sulfopaludibacter sp. SbA3]
MKVSFAYIVWLAKVVAPPEVPLLAVNTTTTVKRALAGHELKSNWADPVVLAPEFKLERPIGNAAGLTRIGTHAAP